MVNADTIYAQKTKLREMIFLAYVGEQITNLTNVLKGSAANKQLGVRNLFIGSDTSSPHRNNPSSNQQLKGLANIIEVLTIAGRDHAGALLHLTRNGMFITAVCSKLLLQAI